MSHQLTRQWSLSKTQISTTVNEDTVILDTASGRYFLLEGVGSTLWEALHQPRSLGELLSAVVARYDVGAERAERDVRGLLVKLEEAGLVTQH